MSSTNEEVIETSETMQQSGQQVWNAGCSNDKFVRCKACNSLMLRPQMAQIEALEQSLPKIEGEHELETINAFWSIKDMFQFENMSFSKTVGETKYLCCCDCEIGPIGFQNIVTKVCYLAPERVAYHDN